MNLKSSSPACSNSEHGHVLPTNSCMFSVCIQFPASAVSANLLGRLCCVYLNLFGILSPPSFLRFPLHWIFFRCSQFSWLHILLAFIIKSSFPTFLYYRKHFCHVSLPCFFLTTVFRHFSAEKSFMLKMFIITTGKSLPTELKPASISHSENLRFSKK